MKKIKLIDFLEFLNFREYIDDNKYDTKIIRIYYPNSSKTDVFESDRYFEYGVYDFSYNTRERIINTLNPKILNLYVYEVNIIDSYLSVYVNTEKYIDDINRDYIDYDLEGYNDNNKKSDILKIYVCSPLRGDIEKNIKKAENHCRFISLKYDAIPICPHIYFTRFLNDNEDIERQMGMDFGLRLLKDCDKMFVFDKNGISEGMHKEIEVAESLNIPIVYESSGVLDIVWKI